VSEERKRGELNDETPKRSISIREIRERMDSEKNKARLLSDGRDFEPGLKFLNGIRGTWKDMEVFID